MIIELVIFVPKTKIHVIEVDSKAD